MKLYAAHLAKSKNRSSTILSFWRIFSRKCSNGLKYYIDQITNIEIDWSIFSDSTHLLSSIPMTGDLFASTTQRTITIIYQLAMMRSGIWTIKYIHKGYSQYAFLSLLEMSSPTISITMAYHFWTLFP